jgi:Ras GTPase-activating-like protein IQGAP2/3
VKSRAIEFCVKLERAGRISRKDHFQGLLVSIASDIRQKHHLRKLQRQNLSAMTKAYEDTTRKKQDFLAQIESYHEFIDSSMANLQKG